MQPNALGLSFWIPSGISFALAVRASRERKTPDTVIFTLLMLSVAIWSLAYSLELMGTTWSVIVFFLAFEYLGISLSPVIWLMLAIQYTGRASWLTRRNILLLLTIPVITEALYLTNGWHHLFLAAAELDTVDSIVFLSLTYGPWHHVFTIYSYLVSITGILLLTQTAWGAPSPIYRYQARVLLVAICAPLLVNVMYLGGGRPWKYLDLTSAAFTASGIIIAWGILRFRLFALKPIARHTLVESMKDVILVLDEQRQIVDANPAAARLFGWGKTIPVGQALATALANWKDLVVCNNAEQETLKEIHLDDQIWEMHGVPLRGPHGQHIGCLITLHNITDRKRTEQDLRESEEKHRVLYNNEIYAIFLFDTETFKLLDANESFVRMYGYDRHDLASGLTVNDLTAEPQATRNTLRQAIQDGTIFIPLRYHRRKDGTIFPVEIVAGTYMWQGRKTMFTLSHDISDRKQAEDTLRENEERYHRQADEFAALYEISRDLAQQHDLDTLLPSIVQRAIKLLGGTDGGMYLYDYTRGDLVVTVGTDASTPVGTRLQIGEGMAGRVAQTRQPLIVDDYRTWEHRSRKFAPTQVTAVIEVPMLYAGDLIGVLVVHEVSTTSRKFTEEDAHLLALFAAQAAGAIHDTQLWNQVQQELVERKQAEQALRQTTDALALANRELASALEREQVSAHTDGLTGLNNRTHFFNVVQHVFEVARRYNQPLTFMILDIDHFKNVNDTLGHLAGDEVLRQVATVAREELRAADIIARYGVEEFIIMLPHTFAAQAYPVAERIRERVAQRRFETAQGTVMITLSIGVANILSDDQVIDQAVERADQAMYAAKNAGRNQVVLYQAMLDRNRIFN